MGILFDLIAGGNEWAWTNNEDTGQNSKWHSLTYVRKWAALTLAIAVVGALIMAAGGDRVVWHLLTSFVEFVWDSVRNK